MNRLTALLLPLLLLLSCGSRAVEPYPIDNLTLWYDQPAAVWEAMLPVGNGRTGAMLDGGIAKERILLNDVTMWSGSKENTDNKEAVTYLPRIRQLLKEGKNLEAQDVMYRHFVCGGPGSAGSAYGSSQLVGWLEVNHRGIDTSSLSGYRRGLSLSNAEAFTQFRSSDVDYSRRAFASRTADVVVIDYQASAKRALSMTLSLSRPEAAKVESVDNYIVMSGELPSGQEGVKGVLYKTIVRAVTDGGRSVSHDGTIDIEGANSVKLIVSTSTDYWGNDCNADAERLSRKACKTNIDKLRQEHRQSFGELFDRVELNIGNDDSIQIPTNLRLRNFQTDNDPSFAALYMQFGRYLLISSTRSGSLPPNLQGMWTKDLITPWRGDYHLNINVEMNHWISEPGNLAELHQPLIEYTKRLVESGERTARTFYNTGGWCAHVLANAWEFTCTSENPSWGATNTGGAWLAMHLWQHYLYNLDKAYLKDVYPTLKGAAQFFLENLIEEPSHGWLVTAPTSSPENGFYPEGSDKVAYICMGSTMDNQIVRELFEAVIAACQTLEVDTRFADSLREVSAKLPPNQISKEGYLMEWLEDYREMDVHHRHVSHLFGLYPGTEITKTKSPELIEAARTTLDRRGDGGTGWSRAWKINFWARIGDGNRAYKLFKSLLEPSYATDFDYGRSGAGTYPNLFCAHPPFQIDGNFGGSAGVVEMLLQSHDGFIELLPALPDVWNSGNFKGLRAQGGFVVDCGWQNGKVVSFTIHSSVGGKCRIKSPFAADDHIEEEFAAGESKTFVN